MNSYNAPQLTELGNIQSLTGIFGQESRADIFVGPNGQVVQDGMGSVDACAANLTRQGGRCIAPPPPDAL